VASIGSTVSLQPLDPPFEPTSPLTQEEDELKSDSDMDEDHLEEPDQLELLDLVIESLDRLRQKPSLDLDLIDIIMEATEAVRCSVEDNGIKNGTVPPYFYLPSSLAEEMWPSPHTDVISGNVSTPICSSTEPLVKSKKKKV